MGQDVGKMPAVSHLELVQRARTHGDLEAWAAFEQYLEGTVLNWLHEHPSREVACRMHNERYFVTRAFEQLRQAVLQRQLVCETLREVLLFLRASLNGAILEAVRVSSRPRAACEHMTAERDREDHPQSLEVWNWLQARLSSERERRLAYLLYHCGLQPTEIVRCCPQEWSDVQEVTRLRRTLFMQLIYEV